jgi:hypothetical protein
MLICDKSTFCSLILAIAFFAGLLYAESGEAATIYIWRDDNGVRQYSDYCPPDEKCRVKRVGKRRKARLLGTTSTSTTDTSTTDTSSTDTSTTSSSGGSTTDTTVDSGTYDTTTDTTADSGADETTTDTTTDNEPTTTGDASTSTDTDDTTSTGTDPVADGSAFLQWDPVSDPSLSGYHLFYAKAGTAYQLVDVGDTTTYSMTGLDSGTRYYFRVAAYDSSGNQSDFSNEVYKDMP